MKRLFHPRNRHRDGAGARTVVVPAVRSALRAGAPVLVAALLVPLVLSAARRHPYFRVKVVELQHRGRLAPETLRAALGVDESQSVWDVDTDAAEDRLLALPWVRSAAVRRVLPDRLVVRVREHRPTAILAISEPEEALYYVAANGRIFAEVGETDGRDLPYVTGLRAGDLDGREGFGPRAIHRALALLRIAVREAPSLGPVSEVHVGRDGGLTLLPVRPAVPIALGTGRYVAKLERVGRVLPLWASREADLAAVTCVREDEVIVRTRTPRAASPTRAASGA